MFTSSTQQVVDLHVLIIIIIFNTRVIALQPLRAGGLSPSRCNERGAAGRRYGLGGRQGVEGTRAQRGRRTF
jgi:hypothetical protein